MSYRSLTPKRATQPSLAGKTELQRLGHKIIADTRLNQQRGPRTAAPLRSASRAMPAAQPRSVVQRPASMQQRSTAVPLRSGVRPQQQQPVAVVRQRTVQPQETAIITRGFLEPLSQPMITRGFVEEISLRKHPRKEQVLPEADSAATAAEPSPQPDESSAPEEEAVQKAFESQLVFAPDSQLSDESPKLIRADQI